MSTVKNTKKTIQNTNPIINKISRTLGDFGIGGNLKNAHAKYSIRTSSTSWQRPFNVSANRKIMERVSKEHNLSSGAGRRSGEKQFKAIKDGEFMANTEYKISKRNRKK